MTVDPQKDGAPAILTIKVFEVGRFMHMSFFDAGEQNLGRLVMTPTVVSLLISLLSRGAKSADVTIDVKGTRGGTTYTFRNPGQRASAPPPQRDAEERMARGGPQRARPRSATSRSEYLRRSRSAGDE